MAYINLFAVLGTLPYLCEIDDEARELANDIVAKANSMEKEIRETPFNWLWSHKRWK